MISLACDYRAADIAATKAGPWKETLDLILRWLRVTIAAQESAKKRKR